MSKRMRLFNLLVCAMFVLFVLSAACVAIPGADHCCPGGGCTVCALVQSVVQLFKTVIVFTAAAAVVAVAAFLPRNTQVILNPITFDSLVCHKVKLSI